MEPQHGNTIYVVFCFLWGGGSDCGAEYESTKVSTRHLSATAPVLLDAVY